MLVCVLACETASMYRFAMNTPTKHKKPDTQPCPAAGPLHGNSAHPTWN